MKKKVDALRFAVGDEVLCKTDLTEWTRGKVVALMYRDDQMPQGMVAPYQVHLEPTAEAADGRGRPTCT